MSDPMPLRSVRVPDDLWMAALIQAAREETTVSDVVRKALTKWITEDLTK